MSSFLPHREASTGNGVAWLLLGVLILGRPVGAAPIWAVDPLDPGEDSPPAGRSLFDHLFAGEHQARGVYDIPFPFEALTAHIEQRVTGSGLPTLKQLLIPRGRSLQRNAAAPEFDRYPRIVVAVDTQGATGAGRNALLLKDRLYLGYQERAEAIEVISYNEEAGRFEFQVVRNYAPGREPKVLYARRAVCTACHQNAGPIFAERPWSETNAEPQVAGSLVVAPGGFHGVPRRVPGEVALAIDASTDEASLHAAHQLLWREGCGGGGSGQKRAVRCRAAVLIALLQYRLTGRAGFETRSRRYREDLVPVLHHGWRSRWPDGLAIPGADLPDPVATDAVPPALLDPLHPRPPATVWMGEHPLDTHRVVAGLAGFLTDDDVRWVDARLTEAARKPGTRREVHRARCETEVVPEQAAGRMLKFRCEGGFVMGGWLEVRQGAVARGAIRHLVVPGMRSLHNLDVNAVSFQRRGSAWTLRLGVLDVDHGVHARRVDGAALEEILLNLREPEASAGHASPRVVGRGSLTVVDDFEWMERAVDALVTGANGDGAGPLSARPFRRAAVLGALAGYLGSGDTPVCCATPGLMPPLEVEPAEAAPLASAAFEGIPPEVGDAFARYCSACHGSANPFPPNFLHGGATSVKAKMARCAPRLYVRLHAWGQPAAGRSRPPMPPASALLDHGMTPATWRTSKALATLQGYVAALVMQAGSLHEAREALLGGGYEALSTCTSAALP